jgi:hypothetical protein
MENKRRQKNENKPRQRLDLDRIFLSFISQKADCLKQSAFCSVQNKKDGEARNSPSFLFFGNSVLRRISSAVNDPERAPHNEFFKSSLDFLACVFFVSPQFCQSVLLNSYERQHYSLAHLN